MEEDCLESQSHAVFYIDLEHFKQINDRFGHATGDEVLRLFGDVMTSYLQSGEIAGRMGGEEFCMFAPNCSSSKTHARAQELLDKFRHQAKPV